MTVRGRVQHALRRLALIALLAAVLGPLLLAGPLPYPSSRRGLRPPSSAPSRDVDAAAPVEATRWVMGTSLRIVVAGPPPRAETALAAAFEAAQRLDGLLSDYDPESPLSQLNASAGSPVPIQPELRAYLRRALRDSERTDGAFDITVGALTRLCRGGVIGPNGSDSTPAANAWAAARSHVGYRRVEVPAAGAVTLPIGCRLDPGGDGKGVAIDAMVRALRAHDVHNAFLDFGNSSMYGMGVPGTGVAGWEVLLIDDRGQPIGTVTLRDAGLTTSSSLRADAGSGSTQGHIVDPRTGILLTAARTAAVLSASGTDGDVLSTALVVDGRDGLRLTARFPGTAAAVFERASQDSSAGRTAWVQPAFARHFRPALSSRS